jgi:hypothetical protein
VQDIPEPSKLHNDQLLLPNLNKNGEFQQISVREGSFEALSKPTEDKNPYSIRNTKMYDSSPEKDKSLDYLGNKIKTLDEHHQEDQIHKYAKRTKKSFYIQKNFQIKCANQKPRDFDYLKA